MIGRNPSYQILFTGSKILILAKVIAFSNLEFTGNYTTRANFNRDLRKTQNLATKKLTPLYFEIIAWNLEVIFYRPIPKTHFFRIFEFRLKCSIMGNVVIFQLWQKHLVSNIAHNKKWSRNLKIRNRWVLRISLKNITFKFQTIISKNEGGVNLFVANFSFSANCD